MAMGERARLVARHRYLLARIREERALHPRRLKAIKMDEDGFKTPKGAGQRAALTRKLNELRREALNVHLEIRALDHAARAREPRPGQAAPSNLETFPPEPAKRPQRASLADWD